MHPTSRSALLRYGASGAAVALALALKFLLIPIVTQDAPFLLFFTAVMVAAWIGGLGPGLVATALATVLNLYFFMKPFQTFQLANQGQPSQLVLFVVEGACISVICANWQAARRRVEAGEREARQLERRILEIADAEQRRIGHDLHDGLGQHLTGIALVARRLEQRLGAAQSPEAADAANMSALAKTAVEWTHDLCRSLSPPVLEREGLGEALGQLAANAENLFHIDCRFEQEGELAFRDVAAGVHLYRIAQEAISNAVKHGHAAHVKVKLSRRDSQLTMQVGDDGTGLSNEPGVANGMGLRIMQYRAKLIGAEVEVARAADGGTIVVCRYAILPQSTLSGASDANQ